MVEHDDSRRGATVDSLKWDSTENSGMPSCYTHKILTQWEGIGTASLFVCDESQSIPSGCVGRKSIRHMSAAKEESKRACEDVITAWNVRTALQVGLSLLYYESSMRESPSQDNLTSPWSRRQNSLRKRRPMVTLCSKHKNDPLSLSGADRAKKASYTAKADHACHCMARFRQYCEQLPVPRLVFRSPRNF
jgi:hypothetical protein